MLAKVNMAMNECPALLTVDDPGRAKTVLDGLTLTKFWPPEQKWAVATLIYKRPAEGGNFLEEGEGVLKLHVGALFADPLDMNAAEKIWTGVQWDRCVSMANNIENVIQKLLEVVNLSSCKFDLFVPESLCWGMKRGVILKLKDHSLSPFTIGAIIKLDSEVASDNHTESYSVGELTTCGEAFLHEAGPERNTIALGVTDFKTIRWFHLSRSADSYTVAQSAPTADVKGSICGFLCAEPESLGLNLKLKIHSLPSSWKLVKHLGSGRTSQVYLVVEKGSRLAVKIPRKGFSLHRDIQYLETLAGIDGIPKIFQRYHSVLALQPVGEPLSHEAISSYKTKGPSLMLGHLVETLQCAHGRGVVNRDLRPDNIIIAESLNNKGELRPFVLDWGFASKIDEPSALAGSVTTASDHVLQQMHGHGYVIVTANDELVSLVRCMYLIFNLDAGTDLHRISEKPEKVQCFWKESMEKSPFWNAAQIAALQLHYESLKDLLSSL